ncbi:MAG: carbohydrate-binding family V/XII, partial [Gammaproteobacteria bacterium]|nr:carbohydrate-binding family V/XII [Gammaproteobacteria bacterium]
NVLTGRTAISIEFNDTDAAVFGALWFSARIESMGDDVLLVRDVRVSKVTWPDSKDAGEQRLTQFVEAAIPTAGFEISRERLTASLATAGLEQKSLAELKSDPPAIVFSEELAVLLLYDGEPRFADVTGSDYQRALNTPLAVARNKRSKKLYLSSGKFWYMASDPLGPWQPTSAPPADLVKLLSLQDAEVQASAEPPVIVVATEPTEVISTDGAPSWKALPGGEVLYVQNTETAWLQELATNNNYVLLSGRWFRAKSTSGPWTFVRADELPPSFAAIPPASDIGGVRVSVANTEEAEQAVLDAAVPQTAAIKRSEATLSVEYDGKPQFEKIAGTEVAYAVNTAAQVLEIDSRYYAVDGGVWFVAKAATGPWVVADSIPTEEIQKIPPSSPVYNTTYVQIYESTPEVVYVGYTPGYLWSYPYYGVPVYGTGWDYPPYWGGGYYYPRPPTWGFNVGYNPWTGWSFGLSWSNGFLSVGVGWAGGYGGGYRPGGWYGGGYRGPTIINTGDINIGNSVNIGSRDKVSNRIAGDNRLSGADLRKDNLYNRPENRARNADRAAAQSDLKQARPATNRKNDVFADKSGAVARRNGDDWESRRDGAWQRESGDTQRPAIDRQSAERDQRAPQRDARPTTLDRRDLNRANSARQRGASRERARPTPRASGMRGGGGRLR